ncbi:MAG TPA: flagellar biosynthetic protein FliQ [Bryobacteraceae bacterium]|nr:flagellar biosynthetic protein FliQ [Bryobacteraceae bacterium]
MTSSLAIDIIRHALVTTFWISLPLLAIGFVVGVLISLIQIVTSIQDASFSAVPRLGAFLLGIILALPWMLSKMLAYTSALFGDFSRYAR